jgi:hypothetical protein
MLAIWRTPLKYDPAVLCKPTEISIADELGVRENLREAVAAARELGLGADRIWPLIRLQQPLRFSDDPSDVVAGAVEALDFLAGVPDVLAPPDATIEWSRPVTKKYLAEVLGYKRAKKAEWINQCVKDGTLHLKRFSRQSWCIDLAKIPENMRDQLRPKSPEVTLSRR